MFFCPRSDKNDPGSCVEAEVHEASGTLHASRPRSQNRSVFKRDSQNSGAAAASEAAGKAFHGPTSILPDDDVLPPPPPLRTPQPSSGIKRAHAFEPGEVREQKHVVPRKRVRQAVDGLRTVPDFQPSETNTGSLHESHAQECSKAVVTPTSNHRAKGRTIARTDDSKQQVGLPQTNGRAKSPDKPPPMRSRSPHDNASDRYLGSTESAGGVAEDDGSPTVPAEGGLRCSGERSGKEATNRPPSPVAIEVLPAGACALLHAICARWLSSSRCPSNAVLHCIVAACHVYAVPECLLLPGLLKGCMHSYR
jgi:hypothetical protein